MRLSCLKSTQNLQTVNSDWQICIIKEYIHRKNPLISAASWLQKSRDANAIKFVPTIWVRHAFQQVLMTEQDCHPGVSPPISTKGTMSHVFTCTSPGTDWGLKCAWSHSTSPSGAEDSYLPTIQVGWNNMRRTTSLLPSP